MADERRERLDPGEFPQLTAFLQGYLHQDFVVVHGGLLDVVRAWRDDAGEDAVRALRDEWRAFLAATRGQTVTARTALLVDELGGAWAPQSRRELVALTRALKGTRLGRHPVGTPPRGVRSPARRPTPRV